jgi:hypothetical protein
MNEIFERPKLIIWKIIFTIEFEDLVKAVDLIEVARNVVHWREVMYTNDSLHSVSNKYVLEEYHFLGCGAV